MQLRLFDKLHVMVLALCSKTKSIGFPSLNQDIATDFYVLNYSIKLYKLQDKYVFYIKIFLYRGFSAEGIWAAGLPLFRPAPVNTAAVLRSPRRRTRRRCGYILFNIFMIVLVFLTARLAVHFL